MRPIILFDLYDTILNDDTVVFERGLTYLYQVFLHYSCTYQELSDYIQSFNPKFKARMIDDSEICFIKDVLPFLFTHFGLPIPEDLYEIELEYMKQVQKEIVLDSVKATLEELQKDNTPMYIVSNSIFTAISTKKFLNYYNIDSYFNKIYSSADCGFRKPNPRFLQSVVDDIKKSEYYKQEEFIFVGNDYHTDVKGAVRFGLKAVWYNVKHQENTECLDIKEIDNFTQLINYLNELNQ